MSCRVSVIIPTYNRASLLPSAIQSVMGQTMNDLEIIVVDDGSIDDTEAVVRNFPSVNYVKQTNQRQGAARNRGFQEAKGQFIATLDSDDAWDSEFLTKSLEALENSDAAFTFSNWRTIDADDSVQCCDNFALFPSLAPFCAASATGWNILSTSETRQIFVRQCPAPSSSFVVRRDRIAHGWYSHFKISDDWSFLLDIILNRDTSCACIPSTNWNKRLDGMNICDRHHDTVGLAQKEIHDVTALLELFESHLTKREIWQLRSKLGDSLHDCAYFESKHPPQRRAALQNILKGFAISPSPRRAWCALKLAGGLARNAI